MNLQFKRLTQPLSSVASLLAEKGIKRIYQDPGIEEGGSCVFASSIYVVPRRLSKVVVDKAWNQVRVLRARHVCALPQVLSYQWVDDVHIRSSAGQDPKMKCVFEGLRSDPPRAPWRP